MVEITKKAKGYGLLSRRREELMGIAMLWVMLFHAYAFHFQVAALDTVKELGFSGVDGFFLLSGVGLYGSIVRRESEPFSAYFARRCARVLPAYWLVVGIYSLWLRAQGRLSLKTALWSLSTFHYWFHIPGSFNWYIPALLLFYLLAPFWVRLLRRSRCKGLLTILAFPAAYGLYRLSIPVGLNYMSDFLDRVPAFALGLLAGCCISEGTPLTRKHAAAWAAGAAAGAVTAFLLARGVLYISTCYIAAAFVMPLCLFFAKTLDVLHWEPLCRILRFFGTYSLEIYLLNVVVTREFETLAPWFDRDGRHAAYYLTVYALNLLLAYLLHNGIEKILRPKVRALLRKA